MKNVDFIEEVKKMSHDQLVASVVALYNMNNYLASRLEEATNSINELVASTNELSSSTIELCQAIEGS